MKWSFITHFKQQEFACKCGCGSDDINSELVNKLHAARSWADIPFIINSACRCHCHNANCGGKTGSSHLKGLAADIHCKTPSDRWIILTALLKAGFTRIGIGPTFVHVDIDPNKPEKVIWVY